jgi:hypothetical protein
MVRKTQSPWPSTKEVERRTLPQTGLMAAKPAIAQVSKPHCFAPPPFLSPTPHRLPSMVSTARATHFGTGNRSVGFQPNAALVAMQAKMAATKQQPVGPVGYKVKASTVASLSGFHPNAALLAIQAKMASTPRPQPGLQTYRPPELKPNLNHATQPRAYCLGAPPVYRPIPNSAIGLPRSRNTAPAVYHPVPVVNHSGQASINTRPTSPLPGAVQAMKRPSFTSNSKKAAVLNHNLSSEYDFEFDTKKPEIAQANAAMPHRLSWSDIKTNTEQYDNGSEQAKDFSRWTKRMEDAGKEKIKIVKSNLDEMEKALKTLESKIQKLPKGPKKQQMEGEKEDLEAQKEGWEKLEVLMKESQQEFTEARDEYAKKKTTQNMNGFLKQAHSFHANVPDFGPHFGVNNPVSEHGHLHLAPVTNPKGKKKNKKKRTRSPSPMSRELLNMSPGRVSSIAVDSNNNIITTTGETVDPTELDPVYQSQIQQHGTHFIKSFDPNYDFGL